MTVGELSFADLPSSTQPSKRPWLNAQLGALDNSDSLIRLGSRLLLEQQTGSNRLVQLSVGDRFTELLQSPHQWLHLAKLDRGFVGSDFCSCDPVTEDDSELHFGPLPERHAPLFLGPDQVRLM